jgi:Uma2 family endonuclease
MTATISHRKHWTFEQLALEFGPIELQRPLSKEEFLQLVGQHPDLRMEREPNGTTTIMSPVKKGTSRRENQLLFLLNLWDYATGNGEVHGPNGTYDLPNGATKMPDASWISPERLADGDGDEESFIQIVPDFVAEIRSGSDRLSKLQEKMTEIWMANGVRLAWLIDPYEEKAYIYRQGEKEPTTVEGFSGKSLDGEAVLTGFVLPLEKMQRRP